jgi:hypothetical protein
MILLPYLESQNFRQLAGHADDFMSHYLESCIWPVNLVISTTENLVMMRQAFRKENMSHTQVFECGNCKVTQTKISETDVEESQEHAYHFLRHEGD